MMVAGFSQVKEDWGDFPTDLAEKRPVIIFDNRGIGGSFIPSSAPHSLAHGPYTVDSMADDALALAEHLHLRKFDLLGLSMGGMIALKMVTKAPPGNIRRLVLLASTSGSPKPSGPGPLFGAIARRDELVKELGGEDQYVRYIFSLNFPSKWPEENPQRFQEALALYNKPKRGLRALMAQSAGLQKFKAITDEQLRTLPAPVLLITGTEDVIVDPECSRHIARLAPSSEKHELKHVGHYLLAQEPDQCKMLINGFLDRPLALARL